MAFEADPAEPEVKLAAWVRGEAKPIGLELPILVDMVEKWSLLGSKADTWIDADIGTVKQVYNGQHGELPRPDVTITNLAVALANVYGMSGWHELDRLPEPLAVRASQKLINLFRAARRERGVLPILDPVLPRLPAAAGAQILAEYHGPMGEFASLLDALADRLDEVPDAEARAARTGLGIAYFYQGNKASALTHFLKASNENEPSNPLLFGRALIHGSLTRGPDGVATAVMDQCKQCCGAWRPPPFCWFDEAREAQDEGLDELAVALFKASLEAGIDLYQWPVAPDPAWLASAPNPTVSEDPVKLWLSIAHYLADSLSRIRPEEAASWLRMLSLVTGDKSVYVFDRHIRNGLRSAKLKIGMLAEGRLQELYGNTEP